ncbi:hypothetical protein LOTGIDRAFT_225368 [Lottia gigantea]|uniref:Tubulin delta chain n=1 Tax=Lottia gigantea TaxID=225164 RepID=V4B5Z3_LOTGI|nr:hypothetical protein LOTGIDRAFT_225368 [Lottia gigantea]ESP01497.1 hypothetical protein LOTGIDRAFT_225368 [Lottia gigantea]
MSMITVQLGQCGNQIGGQLFSTIADDITSTKHMVTANKNREYGEEVVRRYFNTPEKSEFVEARAVMVDMESKVIAQTCQEAKKSGIWKYPDKQQYCQKRGSGNNWAHGYCVHGPNVKDKVMEMVQREAEKCDRLSGFLSLLSLAGGTGSGVGTFINEALRDEFPHSFIMNQVVWPYNTGEVIVQNYNAVLTLSHLYQTADAVVVMENDHLHKICSQLLDIKKISFKDINKVVCHKLASVLLPACDSQEIIHSGMLLHHLVPHPEYKLLSIRNIPQMSAHVMEFSTFQWYGLIKHLRQMFLADAAMEEGIDWQVKTGNDTPRGSVRHNRSLANMLIVRGKDVESADHSLFLEDKLYSSWTHPDLAFTKLSQSRAFNQYEKCAALISNNRSPTLPLNYIVDKAWNMFSSRAYVHQYTKHGLTDEDFMDSFVTLEQVLHNYKKL